MRKRPTISVITATFGRSTIVDCIANVLPQLNEGDEYIVVGDGEVPVARETCALFPRVTYYEIPVHVGDFGCTPFDYGIEKAKGDWIMFLGDDNSLAVNALEIVRHGVEQRPDLPHIFSMMHCNKVMGDSLEAGHVDAHQLVVPNIRDGDESALPHMRDIRKDQWSISDWVFIDKVARQFKGVVFHPDIIAILVRQNHGAML